MEGVDSHTEMESFFSEVLGHVFVGANSGGLEGFGGKLLQLVGDHDDVVREVEHRRLLRAQIVNADLRVGHTTAEPGLKFKLKYSIIPIDVTF